MCLCYLTVACLLSRFLTISLSLSLSISFSTSRRQSRTSLHYALKIYIHLKNFSYPLPSPAKCKQIFFFVSPSLFSHVLCHSLVPSSSYLMLVESSETLVGDTSKSKLWKFTPLSFKPSCPRNYLPVLSSTAKAQINKVINVSFSLYESLIKSSGILGLCKEGGDAVENVWKGGTKILYRWVGSLWNMATKLQLATRHDGFVVGTSTSWFTQPSESFRYCAIVNPIAFVIPLDRGLCNAPLAALVLFVVNERGEENVEKYTRE